MRGEDARDAGRWPPMPAVIRVMTGWFCAGIAVLNLAVELDGGLTVPYVVFHLVLMAGGLLLLTRHRLLPSRAGCLIAGVLVAAGMALGVPYPFGTIKHAIFWGCAGLILLSGITVAERRMPERRTPVDLSENVGGLT